MSDLDSDISSLAAVDLDFASAISSLAYVEDVTSDLQVKDLPELTTDFNALTDYILVQRIAADGTDEGVYKMLVANLSALTQVTKYLDNASFYISSAPQSGSRFIFSNPGVFNLNSSFTLTVGFNHASKTYIKQPGNYAINGIQNLISSTRHAETILENEIMVLYADIIFDETQSRISFQNIFYAPKGSGDTYLANSQTLAQSNFTASIHADIAAS